VVDVQMQQVRGDLVRDAVAELVRVRAKVRVRLRLWVRDGVRAYP
jgi:hypothetical protein